jgi:hypothetical protein
MHLKVLIAKQTNRMEDIAETIRAALQTMDYHIKQFMLVKVKF